MIRRVANPQMMGPLSMQFSALRNPSSRASLVANMNRVMKNTQFRQYASAVATGTGAAAKEGLLDMDKVTGLGQLKFNYPDAKLSPDALSVKVFNKLKVLEAETFVKNKAFNDAYPIKFDPKRAMNDDIFLVSTLCFILFVIFLYNQYVEFAHELHFEIRDSIYGAGFYFLLGLHGGHVVIGTVMLGIVSYLSMHGAINGQSLMMRCTSLYVHLVDLVFVVLVATVYAGSNSPNLKVLVGDLAPPHRTLSTTFEEDGSVKVQEF